MNGLRLRSTLDSTPFYIGAPPHVVLDGHGKTSYTELAARGWAGKAIWYSVVQQDLTVSKRPPTGNIIYFPSCSFCPSLLRVVVQRICESKATQTRSINGSTVPRVPTSSSHSTVGAACFDASSNRSGRFSAVLRRVTFYSRFSTAAK